MTKAPVMIQIRAMNADLTTPKKESQYLAVKFAQSPKTVPKVKISEAFEVFTLKNSIIYG